MGLITHNPQGNTPFVAAMDSRTLPSTKTALVFGQKIVYYDVGSGPLLVLLHGLGSQALFDWGHVIIPLSQQHRVIALDQVGFGQSDKPLIDYSIQTFVDFLVSFCARSERSSLLS
jgi:triacylglycerol lipase